MDNDDDDDDVIGAITRNICIYIYIIYLDVNQLTPTIAVKKVVELLYPIHARDTKEVNVPNNNCPLLHCCIKK